MRIDHGRIRIMALGAFIIGILLMFCTAQPIQAAAAEGAQTLDLQKTGSISIEFLNGETGEPFSFGTKVGVFRVADITLDNGLKFVYDELFESVGEPPTLASQYNDELANRLEEIAEFKGISLEVPSEKIAENGIAKFTDLSPGLFLIIQMYRGTDSPRFQVKAFIVTLPVQDADGSFVYDVDVEYRTKDHGQGSVTLTGDGYTMIDTTSVPAPQKEQDTKLPVAFTCLIGGMAFGFLITRLRKRSG